MQSFFNHVETQFSLLLKTAILFGNERFMHFRYSPKVCFGSTNGS